MKYATLETIRTFRTRNFEIIARAVEDTDVDLSFDETGEVAEKLGTGEFVAFGVVVTAYFRGAEIAEDSLGGCIYETPKAFMDHKGIHQKSRADGRNYGSYFSDLIREVCKEAREKVHALQSVHVR